MTDKRGVCSSVWESFSKVNDGANVKCKTCDKLLKINGSAPSNIQEHLNRKHLMPETACSDKEVKAEVMKSAGVMQKFIGKAQVSETPKNIEYSFVR